MADKGLEAVWRALSDPTRRRLLDLLRDGPRTTGDLCERFARRLSRFAVMKHLAVLQGARLVLVEPRGRERWNHLNPVPLRAVYERWVKAHLDARADALLRLKEHAESQKGARVMDTFGVVRNEMEVPIDVPAAKAWRALVEETPAWWPADFYTDASRPGRKFFIEAHLGGRMYEDWGGGGGLVWANVIGVDPGRWVELLGCLTPQFHGPAMSMMRFEIVEKGKNKCALRLTDTYFGAPQKGLSESLQQGWAYLFEQTFKKFVEG